MSEQHPEIIAAPYTIWIAPVGTAFPAVTAAPGEAWQLLGTNGDRNYSGAGVTVSHQRQYAEATPAGETAAGAVFIEGESLRLNCELLDISLEQYAMALGSNQVTDVEPTEVEAGVRTLGLSVPRGIAPEFAVLARGPSPYGAAMVMQYELPRCCEAGGPQVVFRRAAPAGLTISLKVLPDPAATSEETRFGRMVAQYAAPLASEDGTFIISGVLYGPKIGPRGPKPFLIGFWNQNPVGYCYETNSFTEDLYARWKARGANTCKAQHPDFPATGGAAALLAAVQAKELMLIAGPRWHEGVFGTRPDLASLDFRDLAMNDPYMRINWIGFSPQDEPDLQAHALSVHTTFFAGNALGGANKPGFVTNTRRIAGPATPVGSATISWWELMNFPGFTALGQDSYLWHLSKTDANGATESVTQPTPILSTLAGSGPYNVLVGVDSPTTRDVNRMMKGRRFAANEAQMATHVMRNGPMSRGRTIDGNPGTAFPPIAFQPAPDTNVVIGRVLVPEPLDYDPGDKAVYGYVATGRVDLGTNYPRGGNHPPARYLRDEWMSMVAPGASGIFAFPQCVGSRTITGYVDAATHRLHVTTADTLPAGVAPRIRGAMRVQFGGASVGFIRRDDPQVSGTDGREGVYALDTTKIATANAGSAGSPVTLVISTAESAAGDGTNAANAAEFTTLAANMARMQAHPTGGNLLMDTVNGGRRAFTFLPCPDMTDDPQLYKNDVTRTPERAGYLPDGTPILDSAGQGPGSVFGWPMGFYAWHTTGADGAVYIYVSAMSNGDRPTWFPGFVPLGLPPRVFGPMETAGFRRVGSAVAVEMTGTSAFLKSGQDDGPATHFYIETVSSTVAEGNSAVMARNVVVRRGGNLSGTNAVTAAAVAEGANPANAADFQGGVFPSSVLTFAPGVETQTFTVNVNGDTSPELDETFAVQLSSPTGGAAIVSSGKDRVTLTIGNDDAPVLGAFVWLSESMSGPPALAGVPAGSVHLHRTETTNVTRGGITMRSRGGGAGYNVGNSPPMFADVPAILTDSVFSGALFVLPAGSWEVAIIAAAFAFGSGINGTLRMIDDPNGAANVRQSVALAASGALLMDTDGTEYRTSSTAIASAVNNLTYLPVTITDLGGGTGLLQVHGASGGMNIAAIALRQV
jgi:hypothetical protein